MEVLKKQPALVAQVASRHSTELVLQQVVRQYVLVAAAVVAVAVAVEIAASFVV